MNQVEHWNKYDETGIGVGAYTDFEALSKLVIDKEILEVGCGRGLMLKKIEGAKSKSGIDPSSEAIEFAQSQESNSNFQVAFAEKLPFEDSSFDLVYSLEVIEHVKDYESMVAEIHRVLKPGGVIFIQTPNYPIKRGYDFIYWLQGKRSELKDDYTHVTKLTSFRLKSILKRRFSIESTYSRNIFLDSRIKFLLNQNLKKTIGLFVGQKTIVIGQKSLSKSKEY